jgi:hypothetical protein
MSTYVVKGLYKISYSASKMVEANTLIVTRSGAGRDLPGVSAVKPGVIEEEDQLCIMKVEDQLRTTKEDAFILVKDQARTTESRLRIRVGESVALGLWHRCFAHKHH